MSKRATAVEIGIGLQCSEQTMEYLKKHNFILYLLKRKFNNVNELVFNDIMISEGHGWYSCPLCPGNDRFSVSFGYAKKHFESHIFDIDRILEKEKQHSDTQLF